MKDVQLRLAEELKALEREYRVELPREIKTAVAQGDLSENAEYKAALERQQFVQARLGHLTARLSKLSSIDLSQIPTDKAGLGSRVVVVCQDTKVKETYNLVFGDSDEFDEGSVTMMSPIGRSLLDKKVGDLVLLKLPARTRKMKVVELTTIHEMKA